MSNIRVDELKAALKDDVVEKFLPSIENSDCGQFLNFLERSKSDINTDMYDAVNSIQIYRNFLEWLFATFKEDEKNFRKSCLERFGNLNSKKVLITSCGLGEDVAVASELVGVDGVIHAQDLSKKFVELASMNNASENVYINVSDALSLPYCDNYFDAVYHFGGINLFGDIRLAISEMERVCKVGGQVMFGDESVALHLRNSDYGKMFIHNNSLWEETLPLSHLPLSASKIEISYVLGNCFYLIKFNKNEGLPSVDTDVPHIGYRGGSVRKRYFGRLEGIDPSLRDMLYKKAKEKETSVSDILEILVEKYIE
ncbi:class I SAM-dependent methyltransferase [Thalassospira tepidiphila]|uniref:class I SAM-dependent methyltransferase n=1 Tax=Thalassospira tepidiphila TaxID=393657 RepID=UPI001BCAB083|nr:class I SAM-dependent methyltransferase [Thalassospira tepidiphila]